MIDTPVVPDGGPCEAVSVECANGDVLRTCSAAGAQYVDEACTWGCVDQAPDHCAVFAPGANAVGAADLTGTVDRSIDTALFINGTMRTIDGTVWTPSRVDDVTRVAVFQFKDLTINAPVQLSGAHGIALVASGNVIINSVIDGRPANCTQPAAGPGGFVGGEVGMTANGSGGGTGGANNVDGGGGGGHGAAGGSGASSGTPPAGGPAWGTPTIDILAGGGGGGGGGDGGGPIGGGGGAAIQIVALGTITINSGGGINAGGCGGKGAGNNDSGAGGGAGGTILLEAQQVVINAAGALAVNGGGGGAGNGGGVGQSGRLDRTPALGGTGTATGGVGGAGALLIGTSGVFNGVRGGGGGGAVGRIRINTRSGSAAIDGAAVLSPGLADPQTTATQGRVNLQ